MGKPWPETSLRSLRPGCRFGDLLIQGQLGFGGMGTAFLASHSVLKAPVVLKRFDRLGNKDVFREAHLAARVVSPRTVRILDANQDQGIPYLVQEYVDGIDLAELLDALRAASMPMPLSRAVAILRDARTTTGEGGEPRRQ